MKSLEKPGTPGQPRLGVVKTLKARLEAKRQYEIDKKYGTLEERHRAYTALRDKFSQIFADNPQHVVTSTTKSEAKHIDFDWGKKLGRGRLEESGGTFTLEVVSNPVHEIERTHGTTIVRTLSKVVVEPDQASITDQDQFQTIPRVRHGYGCMLLTTKSEPVSDILEAQLALELVEALSKEEFRLTSVAAPVARVAIAAVS